VVCPRRVRIRGWGGGAGGRPRGERPIIGDRGPVEQDSEHSSRQPNKLGRAAIEASMEAMIRLASERRGCGCIP
jgi:hypothetical protein